MTNKASAQTVLYTPEITKVYDHWMSNGYYDYSELARVIAKTTDKKTHILEIGIGTGNAAIPLARLGYSVDGIDQSPFMLKGLQAKLDKEPLPIKYFHQDIAEMKLSTTYDLVFAVGGPFWVAQIGDKFHLHAQLDKAMLEIALKQTLKALSSKGRLMVNIQRHGAAFKRRLPNGMDYHFVTSPDPQGSKDYIIKTHYFHKQGKLILEQPYRLLQLNENEAVRMFSKAGFTAPELDADGLFWVIRKK